MAKFKLIKEYPGSPELGSVCEPNGFGVIAPQFSKHEVEKYKEFWQEVDENAFGIKSFWANGQLNIICNDEGCKLLESDNEIDIISIVRLSDKQVFKVGDYVSLNNSWGDNNKISNIKIVDKNIVFTIMSDLGNWMNYDQPLSEWNVIDKKPLFKTNDGVENKSIYHYLRGCTTRKIIEDLLFEFHSSEDLEDQVKFLNLLKEPIEVYNKYNNGKFILPKI